MIDFTHIVEPLSGLVLRWARRHQLTLQPQNLHSLTDGEWFMKMLERVQGFRLIGGDGVDWQEEPSLGNRIARMRVIGRSLIAYKQARNCGVMEGFRVNYVEMCTGQAAQMIKFLLLWLGVVVQSQQTTQEITEFMSEVSEQEVGLFNSMLSFSQSLNVQCSPQGDSSPVKRHKRLLTRLQIVEEELEWYQDYVGQLEGRLEQCLLEAKDSKVKLESTEKIKTEMTTRIEELEIQNEQVLKQLKEKEEAEQILNLQLSRNQGAAEDVIGRLKQELQKEKQMFKCYKELTKKCQLAQNQVERLSELNHELESQAKNMKVKMSQLELSLHQKEQQLHQSQHQHHLCLTEIDSLRLKVNLLEQSISQEHYLTSPLAASVVQHKALSSSFFNSSQQTFQDRFTHEMTAEELAQRNSVENQSLNMTVQSTHPAQMDSLVWSTGNKQNFNSNNQQGDGFLGAIKEEKSFEVSQEDLREEHAQQIGLLIQVVIEQRDRISWLESERKKQMQVQQRKQERNERFAQKVNRMFA